MHMAGGFRRKRVHRQHGRGHHSGEDKLAVSGEDSGVCVCIPNLYRTMTPRKIPKDLAPGRIFTVERGLFVRKRKDGSLVWGISYMVNYELHRETIGPHKTIAREALAARKSDIARGKYDLTKPADYPYFTDFVDTYLEHAKQHKRSWKRDQAILKTIVDFLSQTALPALQSFIRPWKSLMTRPHA